MNDVYSRFSAAAERTPTAAGLIHADTIWDYAEVRRRVELAAVRLRLLGVERGDRVGVLSENSPLYTIVQLACAKLGAMVACMNWRLRESEMVACLAVVSPKVLLHSARYAELAGRLSVDVPAVGSLTDACPTSGSPDELPAAARPEDGLLIIFTSGTTGLPKAAVISHRAHLARMAVLQNDLGLDAGDAFIAWSPMFHMGGSEHSLSSLMFGAPVVVQDGLDVPAMARVLRERRVGWLLLVPATVEPLLEYMADMGVAPVGIKAIGCMPDLMPLETVRAAIRELHAPFLNSFGSTETGLPPLSGGLLCMDTAELDLGKRMNSGCELRLMSPEGSAVPDGVIGEAWVRGDNLFSGYFRDGQIDGSAMRDGWFPMGDLLARNGSGTYRFMGRSKYLIKSGGENIYPAEIEGVLLVDQRVEDAVVVRRADSRWGEVPVVFVVRRDPALTREAVEKLCRAAIAGYKIPKDVIFVEAADLPRNASGKIVREELEKRLHH
jgi:acyl-CoA synthetase (AMP-forming)/AMP-acid ligase II